MGYEIKKYLEQSFAEIKFIPPIEVNEYFEVQEKYFKLNSDDDIRNFIIDVSDLVVKNFDQKDVTIELVKSLNIEAEDDLYLAIILPEDLKSKNEVYFMSEISRLEGVDVDVFSLDEMDIARRKIKERANLGSC